MTPYQLEQDRLANELPTDYTARLAYYKRRGPLGDAEFYRWVCGAMMPGDLESELNRLIVEMQVAFNAKKTLTKFKAPLRDIMRRFRLAVPPETPQDARFVAHIPGPFTQQVDWYGNGAQPAIRELHNPSYRNVYADWSN